jgi:hypothetical protein
MGPEGTSSADRLRGLTRGLARKTREFFTEERHSSAEDALEAQGMSEGTEELPSNGGRTSESTGDQPEMVYASLPDLPQKRRRLPKIEIERPPRRDNQISAGWSDVTPGARAILGAPLGSLGAGFVELGQVTDKPLSYLVGSGLAGAGYYITPRWVRDGTGPGVLGAGIAGGSHVTEFAGAAMLGETTLREGILFMRRRRHNRNDGSNDKAA